MLPPNSTTLFVEVAVKLKMRLIAKGDFLQKITVDLMLQYLTGECSEFNQQPQLY